MERSRNLGNIVYGLLQKLLKVSWRGEAPNIYIYSMGIVGMVVLFALLMGSARILTV